MLDLAKHGDCQTCFRSEGFFGVGRGFFFFSEPVQMTFRSAGSLKSGCPFSIPVFLSRERAALFLQFAKDWPCSCIFG